MSRKPNEENYIVCIWTPHLDIMDEIEESESCIAAAV